MRLLYQVTALLLLAVWLLVTKHSVLEMAGLIPDHGHHAAMHAGGGQECGCERPHVPNQGHSGWDVADKSVPKPSSPLLKIAMPLLCVLAFALTFFRLPFREPMLSSVAEIAFERPRGWVPRWHFERRAAPVCRAPSVLAV